MPSQSAPAISRLESEPMRRPATSLVEQPTTKRSPGESFAASSSSAMACRAWSRIVSCMSDIANASFPRPGRGWSQPVPDGTEEAALFDDILDKGREGLGLIGFAGGPVLDMTPVSKSTRTSSPARISRAASSHSRMARPITQEMPLALMAMGACSREEPQPKFFSATRMSPVFTLFTKSGRYPPYSGRQAPHG